jgi:hypothetical protein
MTAIQALELIIHRAQYMRSEGESDMRSIIYLASGLIRDIEAGKSAEEIMADYNNEDEE